MANGSSSRLQIFVDFDGTITSRDSIVYLTETWGGGPDFRRQILGRIEEGSLSVFEAIEQELATVRVGWEEAAEDLRKSISVDPEFGPFVEWCRGEGHPVVVLSSGIEQVVSLFIGHLGVPYFAHPVRITDDGWFYRRDPSSDKVAILKASRRREPVVYVGDGTSDVAVLPYVDVLFAKSYLERYCRRNSIPFFPFETFRDVRAGLEAVLAARTPGAG